MNFAFLRFIGQAITYFGIYIGFSATIGRDHSSPNLNVPTSLFLTMLVMGIGQATAYAAQKAQQKALDERAAGVLGRRHSIKAFSLFLRPFNLMSKWSIQRPFMGPFQWEQYDRLGSDALERIFAEAVEPTAPMIGLGAHASAEFGLGVGGFVDNWKSQIETAMENAAYIFVVPSATEGTLWEIGLIKERGYFYKTVFVMPPSSPPFKFKGEGPFKDSWEAARAACARDYKLELPPYRDLGGLFLMSDTVPVRGKAFKGFSPRDIAKRINALVQA